MKVTVLSTIKHDNKTYNTDDVIEVTKSEAKRLVEAGVARIPDEFGGDEK